MRYRRLFDLAIERFCLVPGVPAGSSAIKAPKNSTANEQKFALEVVEICRLVWWKVFELWKKRQLNFCLLANRCSWIGHLL